MKPSQTYSIPLSPSVGVLIPAAGFGTRMGANVPKQFLELAGVPILVRTISVFLQHPLIDSVVIVLPEEYLQSAKEQILSFVAQDLQSILMN